MKIPISDIAIGERRREDMGDIEGLAENIKAKFYRTPINPRLRFEVLRRDHFRCQYCGRRAPHVVLEVDHIIPVAKGGTNTPENLVTACHECNRGKSDEILEGLDGQPIQIVFMSYVNLASLIEERVEGLAADYAVVVRLRDYCLERFGKAPQIPTLEEESYEYHIQQTDCYSSFEQKPSYAGS